MRLSRSEAAGAPWGTVQLVGLLLMLFCGLSTTSLVVGVLGGALTPTRYVSTTGKDTNNGLTPATAFATIAAAAKTAQPGAVIQVQNGVYQVSSGANAKAISMSVSGTASQPITFQAETKWGVLLNDTGTGLTWSISGKYIVIDGFEITGASRVGILFNTGGDYGEVKNCYVHDLLATAGVGGAGGAGIDGVGNGIYVHHNRVQNIDLAQFTGHSTVHGIYLAGADWRVTNNIVGGCAAGGIHAWHGQTTATITNNTVFSSAIGIILGQGDSGAIIPPGTHDNFIAYNVIYNNPSQGIAEYCYSGQACIGVNNSYVYNCIFGSAKSMVTSYGKGQNLIGNKFLDPQFVRYAANGQGDYTLAPNSPCRGWGAGWMWDLNPSTLERSSTGPAQPSQPSAVTKSSSTGSGSGSGSRAPSSTGAATAGSNGGVPGTGGPSAPNSGSDTGAAANVGGGGGGGTVNQAAISSATRTTALPLLLALLVGTAAAMGMMIAA